MPKSVGSPERSGDTSEIILFLQRWATGRGDFGHAVAGLLWAISNSDTSYWSLAKATRTPRGGLQSRRQQSSGLRHSGRIQTRRPSNPTRNRNASLAADPLEEIPEPLIRTATQNRVIDRPLAQPETQRIHPVQDSIPGWQARRQAFSHGELIRGLAAFDSPTTPLIQNRKPRLGPSVALGNHSQEATWTSRHI